MGTLFTRHLRSPAFGFALYGACALVAQLALLQELVIVFAGHELFLGFSLASWMGWVGAGSFLARRRSASYIVGIAVCFIPIFIANIIAIRLSKLLFGFGMLIGLLPMLAVTFVLLAPIGLVVGACFSWGCEWCSRRNFSIGAAYLWETIGAVLGGIFYSVFIAGNFSVDYIIAFLAIPVALITAGLSAKRRSGFILGFIIVVLGIAWTASPLPRFTRTLQWGSYQLLTERSSRYSHLALAQTGSLTTLFENGVVSSHFPDPSAYEELVHLPLLAHPSPKHVLVIGGAATGTLTELLKHPITKIDYVELDPAVISLLKPALPPADRASLSDPRMHTIHQDGRKWLIKTNARYDVILLQLPEPQNAQINRLYTLEAFREIKAHLMQGGLFAFTIPSSENYLSPETAYFNACLYHTLKAAFTSVEIIAGDPLLLLASSDSIALNVPNLTSRYHKRRLATRQVVPSYLPFKLQPERRAVLLAQLEDVRVTLLNRDFFPVCYAYAWRVWLSKFVSPIYFLSSLALLAFLAWLFRFVWQRRTSLRRNPGAAALFLIGGVGIAYETILLLAFQSLHGYVYWQLGILFAAFMLGLSLGCGLIVRLPKLGVPHAYRWLRLSMLTTGFMGVVLMWLLPRLKTLLPFLPPLVPFVFLLILIALCVGAAFPLATRLATSRSISRTAGNLYAADLWGASLGAILTSSVLVPLIGLTATAGTIGLVLLAAGALLPALAPAK